MEYIDPIFFEVNITRARLSIYAEIKDKPFQQSLSMTVTGNVNGGDRLIRGTSVHLNVLENEKAAKDFQPKGYIGTAKISKDFKKIKDISYDDPDRPLAGIEIALWLSTKQFFELRDGLAPINSGLNVSFNCISDELVCAREGSDEKLKKDQLLLDGKDKTVNVVSYCFDFLLSS